MIGLDVKIINYADELHAAVESGLVEIGEHLLQETSRLIDEPYPPASEPGTPPHKRSGTLQGSGTVERVGGRVQLIYSAPYAGYLEEGTETMDPRPFVSYVMQRDRAEIIDLLIRHVREQAP